MWLLLFLNASLAISFTIAKAVLIYSKPLFFVGIRMFVAGIILLGYTFYRHGKKALLINKKDWLAVATLTLTHIYLTYVLDLLALQHMSSGKGAFIGNLSPFITALISYFYFAEIITPKKWFGLIIGFSGFLPEVLIKSTHAYQDTQLSSFFILTHAELMMIASIFTSCIGWIILRGLLRKQYSPVALNGTSMFLGGASCLVTSLLYERWDIQTPVFNLPPFLGLTFLIIIIANIGAYNLYGFLLKKYTATFISFTGFTIPLFAAFFGWIFLNEQISWYFLFSTFVITIGLWIFHAEDLRQGYNK